MSPRKRLFQSTVLIRMPEDLRSQLSRLAEKSDRNMSDYCRAALREHVERMVPPAGREGGADAPADLANMVREEVANYFKKGGKRHGKA